MKITDTTYIQQTQNVRRRNNAGNASGVDFADFLTSGGTEDAAATSDSAPVAATSMDNLLALQSISEEEARRQRTIKQGHSLLDSLEQLRHSLLMGKLSVDVLRSLDSRIRQQREMTADPRLHEIMDDIELRAAVELAKIDNALNNRDKIILTDIKG